MITVLIFSIFLMCLVLLGAALIALQIISEEMYSRILKTRSFTLGQSWYASTQLTVLRLRYIWGETSRQMLRHQELRGIVFFARIASVVMYLSSGGILLTIILLTLGY